MVEPCWIWEKAAKTMTEFNDSRWIGHDQKHAGGQYYHHDMSHGPRNAATPKRRGPCGHCYRLAKNGIKFILEYLNKYCNDSWIAKILDTTRFDIVSGSYVISCKIPVFVSLFSYDCNGDDFG